MASVAIENIEELRLKLGIDDVQLRAEIRTLQVGDIVKITILKGPTSIETLVRITSIRGSAFQGKLTKQPPNNMPDLPIGSPIHFSADHIHSIPSRQRPDDGE